jgi:hypothetical protein
MKAIITRANPDGSFDEVGMNNRTVTKSYKTRRGLFNYGLPENFRGRLRIEIFSDERFYGDPIEIMEVIR